MVWPQSSTCRKVVSEHYLHCFIWWWLILLCAHFQWLHLAVISSKWLKLWCCIGEALHSECTGMVIDRELSSASFLTTASLFGSFDQNLWDDLTVCAANFSVLCLLIYGILMVTHNICLALLYNYRSKCAFRMMKWSMGGCIIIRLLTVLLS
jgi:hypothetical protein